MPDARVRKASLGSSWVSQDVPGASPGLPGLSRRPRGFPGSPWRLVGLPGLPGTSPGPPGPPGHPRGFPGPPWDVRTFQGLPWESLESPRLPQMSQGLPRTLCGLRDFRGLPKASWELLCSGRPRSFPGPSGASPDLPGPPWTS